MLTERLDIMISPEMRRLVKDKAKFQRITVGALVRESIRKDIGATSQEEKRRALHRLFNAGIKLPPNLEKLPRQEVENV